MHRMHALRPACLLSLALLCVEIVATVEPPSIVTSPRNQTVEAGRVALFVCTATGDPQPLIEWRKNGRRVSNTFRYTLTEMAKGSVLRISPVRAQTDNSGFECLATNGVGDPALAQFTLTVLEENRTSPGFPRFELRLPELLVVYRNSSILLPCKPEANPKPTLSWLHYNVPVNMSDLRYSIDGEDDIHEEDRGRYDCVAENSVGTASATIATVYIRDRRELPYFLDQPESTYEASPGDALNLTCAASGSPKPYVRWLKENIDLTTESAVPVGRNVLLLKNVRESANYTCVASSSLGTI